MNTDERCRAHFRPFPIHSRKHSSEGHVSGPESLIFRPVENQVQPLYYTPVMTSVSLLFKNISKYYPLQSIRFVKLSFFLYHVSIMTHYT